MKYEKEADRVREHPSEVFPSAYAVRAVDLKFEISDLITKNRPAISYQLSAKRLMKSKAESSRQTTDNGARNDGKSLPA